MKCEKAVKLIEVKTPGEIIKNAKTQGKQYCRYCIYLCVNNVPYCTAKNEYRNKESCKRPNKCKEFCFANVPPEYQDAFGETNGYIPHKPKKKQCDGQISLFD